jgi:hypothetical protein
MIKSFEDKLKKRGEIDGKRSASPAESGEKF